MARWLIGVDEAGRGPLAGPVAVGIVRVPKGFDIPKRFPGVGDSKKLSSRMREELFVLAQKYQQAGELDFCVRYGSPAYIDEHGITKAVRRGVWSGVRHLAGPGGGKVMLDGLLAAPPEYEQETVIRGDDLIPVISLASIVAKVSRDRLMQRMARRYPQYGFDAHKGYGTEAHQAAIQEHGLCGIHRRSFCKNISLDPSIDTRVGLLPS